MNWYEYAFTYAPRPDAEAVNALLSAALGEAGFESFMETENALLAYIPEGADNAERLEAALASLPLEGLSVCFSKTPVPPADWNEVWEKHYFKPVTIGAECVVHASFHQVEPGCRYDITINPKMAFGTGHHETTLLMLGEILGLDVSGKVALDMGCGTAVLSILLALKGASSVTAVDTDEWAYRNALENIGLNRTSPQVHAILGDAGQLPFVPTFDLVFANISRNVLLNDIPHYARCMKPGAALFLSGFYTGDLPSIRRRCSRHALTFLSSAEKNRWAMGRWRKSE